MAAKKAKSKGKKKTVAKGKKSAKKKSAAPKKAKAKVKAKAKSKPKAKAKSKTKAKKVAAPKAAPKKPILNVVPAGASLASNMGHDNEETGLSRGFEDHEHEHEAHAAHHHHDDEEENEELSEKTFQKFPTDADNDPYADEEDEENE